MSLFDLFSQRKHENPPGPSWEDFRGLEARMGAVERSTKTLLLDWEDSYEKIHRSLQRLNKRTRDAAKAEKDEPGAEDPPVSEFRARVLERRHRRG